MIKGEVEQKPVISQVAQDRPRGKRSLRLTRETVLELGVRSDLRTGISQSPTIATDSL